jgi:hypothetical protein
MTDLWHASEDHIAAAVDEVLELAEPQKPQWPSASRRRTVVVDSTTNEPVRPIELSSREWDERIVAKATAKHIAERFGR